ncbi:MAG: methyltransferase domain-containing protein [Candidatus Marinimicrobia bacterium]|nr:methyltransferase domain-containing protein [Candidatus Neomarinimicrobiota bacterium]
MAYKFPAEKFEKLESRDRYDSMKPVQRLKNAGIQESDRVLDIGSGTGFYSRAAAELVGNSGNVIGIDILEEMLEKARELGLKPNLEYRLSEEASFPVEDDSMDWAIMTNLYHELEKPEQFIQEIDRVLHQSGSVYVTDWLPKEQDDGPPVEHRIDSAVMIKDFEKFGFKLQSESSLADSHYEVVLSK